MSYSRLSLSAQLWHFVRGTVLPVVPAALWWALAAAGFSALNLLLCPEIWPHTPAAAPVFEAVLVSSLPVVAGLLARTAGAIRRQLTGWFWRMGWVLVEIGGWLAAALLTMSAAIGLALVLG